MLILVKDEAGEVEAMELSDLDDLGPLERIEADLAELLAEDDVVNLAAAMDPGSTAGVLIYENLWVAPFASPAPGRWSADRERTDPDSSHHRRHHGGRRTRDSRRLTSH